MNIPGLVLGQSFLTLHTNNTRSGNAVPVCPKVDAESCVRADVNLGSLRNDASIELPNGKRLELTSRGEHSAVFKVNASLVRLNLILVQ